MLLLGVMADLSSACIGAGRFRLSVLVGAS